MTNSGVGYGMCRTYDAHRNVGICREFMFLTALVLVGGYEDGFLCQREPNSRRIISYEDKRYMLVFLKLAADSSRGCALSVISPAYLLTHPTLPFVDRFMPVLSPYDQASASQRGECLFTAPISCAWQQAPGWRNRPSSAPIGVGYAASCCGLLRIALPRRWVNRRRVAALRPKKSLQCSTTAAVASSWARCEQRGIVSRREPGMASCSRQPRSRSIHRSSSPYRISTGRSMPP
jgi:hypothetical protein